ncbi:MAG: RNA ligase family protein [Methanomethylophilus sp.]
MKFAKYMKVEKLDATEVQGLTDGKCYIFPKLDGVQVSCWLNDDDQFRAGDKDGQTCGPFDAYAQEKKDIGYFLEDYPYLRLYGEYIGKSGAYAQSAWNKWYVFEVCSERKSIAYSTKDENGISVAIMDDGHYCLPYDVYAPLLKKYNIECVPPLKIADKPIAAEIQEFADKENKWNTAGECGEGVIVKNYDFKNTAEGTAVWGKALRTGYQKSAAAEEGTAPIEITMATEIVTPKFVQDVIASLTNPNPGIIINTVWKKIETEALPAAKAKHGNPGIDMKMFRKDCENRIRTAAPEHFHVKKV